MPHGSWHRGRPMQGIAKALLFCRSTHHPALLNTVPAKDTTPGALCTAPPSLPALIHLRLNCNRLRVGLPPPFPAGIAAWIASKMMLLSQRQCLRPARVVGGQRTALPLRPARGGAATNPAQVGSAAQSSAAQSSAPQSLPALRRRGAAVRAQATATKDKGKFTEAAIDPGWHGWLGQCVQAGC